MSLLLNPLLSVESSYNVKKLEEQGGLDTVLIGKNLWHSIVSDSDPDRVCISIAPRGERHTLPSLTCWAILDEKTDGLAIPSTWLRVYASIFEQGLVDVTSEKSLVVTSVKPVLLTEVVIMALSRDAYQAALGREPLLDRELSDGRPILRQGAVYTFSSSQLALNGHGVAGSPKHFSYRLDMLEPVRQGYTQRGTTQFTVVLDTASDDGEDSHLADAENGVESDREGLEIDESFLGNSILTPVFPPSARHSVHGVVHESYKEISASPQDVVFRALPLRKLASPGDDDCTLYLRTVDLGRVGLLKGDWAVARSHHSSKYRLVRIAANDNLVSKTGVIAGSPILLHNISSGSSQNSSRLMTFISLHGSPFGSRQPVIPTARSITVARVASPLSTNRAYEAPFLRSLKMHFAAVKRLIKSHDIIAVPLDTDAVGGTHEVDGLDDSTIGNGSFYPLRTNEVVFFIVTNVEHDVIMNDTSSPAYDAYVGSTVGELGCWVDPSVTRIIQTGVEQSRIPDVGKYMQLDPESPRALLAAIESLPSSRLIGSESPFSRLYSLLSATLARRAVDYKLHLSILLKGSRGIGKFTTTSWVAQRLGMHLLEINCYDIVGENDIKTEGTLRARFDKASACSPCIFVLRHLEALVQTTQAVEPGKEPVIANVLRDCIDDMQQGWNMTGYPVVVFGTTSEPGRLANGILSSFKHEVLFEAPNESERYEILNCLLTNITLAPDVSLFRLATQTAALVASDLVDLVSRAKLASTERAIRVTIDCRAEDLIQAGIPLTAADFATALGSARASYSENIGAPKIPNVTWDDVGGLAHVKSDILDTIQLPLDHPELFADGLKKRSGILLYGPPGTGKTLLAKAVATSCSLNFFSIKGPELLNMYIGESEANVRRVFQRARDAKPCVIFFDELDSVAPKRGNQGDSGGVMDRIVSQLLAELDGMSGGKGGADVFVIGATNRPDLLDPALLRPGRFDRMLYLGVSDTHQAQLNILEALTRKFRLDPDLDLRKLAEQCPFNYTGADFYALCSDAMLNAMSRKAEALEAKITRLNGLPGPYNHPHPLSPQYFLAEMASADDMDVLVSQQDFDLAFRTLVPSVSQSEMEHYAHIQRRFSRDIHDEEEEG